MIKCYECLYNNDGICQNECSFDLEDDNCLEFESRDTYAKGYQQGKTDERAELLDKVMQKQRTIIDDDGVMYKVVLLKDIEDLKAGERK